MRLVMLLSRRAEKRQSLFLALSRGLHSPQFSRAKTYFRTLNGRHSPHVFSGNPGELRVGKISHIIRDGRSLIETEPLSTWLSPCFQLQLSYFLCGFAWSKWYRHHTVQFSFGR